MAYRKRVDYAFIGQDDPLGFFTAGHAVAAWIGVGVAGLRIARAEQDAVGQACKEWRILSVGMQIRDRVDLFDLKGRHLLEQRQRFFIQYLRERDVVDDVSA